MGVVPEVKIEVQRLGRKEDMVFGFLVQRKVGGLGGWWWLFSLPPFFWGLGRSGRLCVRRSWASELVMKGGVWSARSFGGVCVRLLGILLGLDGASFEDLFERLLAGRKYLNVLFRRSCVTSK